VCDCVHKPPSVESASNVSYCYTDMGNIKLTSSPLCVDMFTLVKLNGEDPLLFYMYLHYI